MNEYDIGDAVRFNANFKNSAGADTDPTVVVFKVKDPSGNAATYTYGGTGSNTLAVKDNTGDYHVDVTLDESGIWHYRWSGTGVLDAAEEAKLRVVDSAF